MDLQNLAPETLHGFTVSTERKRINLVYLDLLQEFDRLCRKNNITYWVFFGTLLGAVRHRGFIPWDDDVDIMMPREDFDRLLHMSSEEFGAEAPYFLQNMNTDAHYPRYLQRFRRGDTACLMEEDITCLREHPRRADYNMGLNLSIFPLDDCPSSAAAFRWRKAFARLVMGVEYRARRPKTEKPFQHKICLALRTLLGGRFFVKTVYACFRVKKTKSPMVTCLDGFYPARHYWHREDFDKTVYLPFETLSVPAPAGYDRLLTERYGNYMEFPPFSERAEKHDFFMSAEIPYAEAAKNLDALGL